MIVPYLATLLSCLGLTWILMYGTILDRPRKWLTQWKFFNDLLKCAKCTGFWAGVFHVAVFVSVAMQLPVVVLKINQTADIFTTAAWTTVVMTLPFQSSAFCYIADWLIEKLTQDISNFYHGRTQKPLTIDDSPLTLINEYKSIESNS